MNDVFIGLILDQLIVTSNTFLIIPSDNFLPLRLNNLVNIIVESVIFLCVRRVDRLRLFYVQYMT